MKFLLSKPNKKAIQDSLDKLKSIHKEEKIDEIDSAIEALNKSWEAASQEMYKATQEQQGAPDQKTPAGNKTATNLMVRIQLIDKYLRKNSAPVSPPFA